MTFDASWQMVRCRDCGREYQCTPEDDYYNATTTEDGLCEPCVLRGAGFTPTPPQVLDDGSQIIGRKRKP